jgi:hypothetical protein
MEPLGIFIFAIFLALVLIAIIVPQIQNRQQSEDA